MGFVCFFPNEAGVGGAAHFWQRALYKICPNTEVGQTGKLSNATQIELGQRDEGSSSEANASGTNPQNKWS